MPYREGWRPHLLASRLSFSTAPPTLSLVSTADRVRHHPSCDGSLRGSRFILDSVELHAHGWRLVNSSPLTRSTRPWSSQRALYSTSSMETLVSIPASPPSCHADPKLKCHGAVTPSISCALGLKGCDGSLSHRPIPGLSHLIDVGDTKDTGGGATAGGRSTKASGRVYNPFETT